MRHYYYLLEWLKTKQKNQTTPSAGQNACNGTLKLCQWKMQNDTATLGHSLTVAYQVKYILTHVLVLKCVHKFLDIAFKKLSLLSLFLSVSWPL